MNAKFTMRMAMGCSILVAVCQSAAMAGGFGGSSGMHSSSAGNHTSFQSSSQLSNFKSTSNFKVTPSNTFVKSANINTKVLSSNNLSKTTLSKTPVLKNTGIGLSQNTNKNMFKTLPVCSPVGKCLPGQNCWSNWLCYNPWFFGYCGYDPFYYNTFGYCDWGYGYNTCATPIVLNITTTPATVAVNQVPSKMTLQLGQSYSIANENYGEKSGDLSVQVSGLTLPVRIDKWDAQQINFTVPGLGLEKPTDGVFQIAGADHNLSKSVPVIVIAAK